MAQVDVLAFLPAPTKGHCGAADILEQSAFAHGVSTCICVYEVHRLHLACTLQGGHKAPVTAVKWCPAYHSRDFKEVSHLRLASGDAEGGVVVWDVLLCGGGASQLARLEDVPAAREVLREYCTKASSSNDASSTAAGSSAASSGITSLAWVMPGSNVLAVVVAPALLLLWDVTTGSVLWKRELGSGPQLFGQLAVAPLDSRQLCLCGSSGALVMLQLTDPARDKVQLKQYRVNTQAQESSSKSSASSSSSSSLHALFGVAPGLLVLLLPRELLLFDLELGCPAASTPLGPGMPPFSHLLGVFGGGVCQGGGDEGGMDFAYCAHTDGGLSVWVRVPGELRFKLGSMSRLTPAPIRGASSQASLCMIKACLWRHHPAEQAAPASARTAASTASITAQLTAQLTAMHLTREGQTSSTAGSRRAEGSAGAGGGGSAGSSPASATTLSSSSLLVMAVTSDGRLWQWELALPRYPKRSFLTNSDERPITAISGSIQAARAAAAPATVMPQLVGLMHGLPGSITATCLQPRPLLLPSHINSLTSSSSSNKAVRQQTSSLGVSQDDSAAPSVDQQQPSSRSSATDSERCAGAAGGIAAVPAAECVVLGAAATSTGHIEVFSLRRGLVNPLAVEVASSHAVHRYTVRGLRWLGASPLLVSFSSEKSSSGGWKNSLMLTDVRTGRSVAFRDGGGSENSPMLGIRVSPSGAYLLLLLKGAPAELWTTLPPHTAATTTAQQQQRRVTDLLAAPSAGAGTGAKTAAAAGPAGGGCLSCLVKPWRVRLVDLPFTSVEWVVAEEDLQKDLFNVWAPVEEQDQAAAAGASPGDDGGELGSAGLARTHTFDRQASMGVNRALSALAAPSMSVAAADPEVFPTELLAFALVDGRSGVLSVRGRKVSDMRPRRPSSSPSPGDSVGSALAAVWPLMVQGDGDGTLLAWDLSTGRCSSLATGCGMVRRIQLAPASPPVLSGAVESLLSGGPARGSGCERMRVAVLFAGGLFGVYELDAAGRLRPSAANPAACGRVGRALDISWVSMPGAAGAGSVLSVVLEDGSLSLLDVAGSQQATTTSSTRARQALLHQVLNTPTAAQPASGQLRGAGSAGGVSIPVVLMCPRPLGSSMMLQQPWVLLLRCLLQLGVSQNALLYISSSSTEEDDDVRQELQQLLPRSARATLAHMAAAGPAADAALQPQQLLSGAAASQASSSGGVRRPTTSEAATAAGQQPGVVDPPAISKAKSSPLLKGHSGSSTYAALPQSSSARVLAAAGGQQGSSSMSLLGVGGASRASQQESAAAASYRALLGFGEQRFDGDLVKLLRRIAKLRGSGQLLHADEWRAYTEALSSGLVAKRMSVAARLSGHQDEARFWTALPPTLASVKALHTAIQTAQQQQQQAPAASPRQTAAPAAAPTSAADTAAAAAVTLPQCEAAYDDLPDADVSEYDRMVQQAMESKTLAEPGATPTKASAAASAAAGPFGMVRPAAQAAAGQSPSAASAAGSLARRGSGVAVPGHVRASGPAAEQFSERGAIRVVAADRAVRLWDEEVVVSDAQERLLWHEALPGQLFEAEGLLEVRLLEYVVLGDFATAVAFLLSTTPESSVRYYRSVVCALALAATASLRAQSSGSSTNNSAQAAATLHLQAAKVVSAHAASIGDNLLGVPLNCSAGLNADAVTLLQEAGMWRFAANLIARSLSGTERAQALSRWAAHVLHQEGSVWRCVGILTSAGCLAAAVQVLRGAGLPDCAQAYVVACQQAGLLVPVTPGSVAQQAAAGVQQQQKHDAAAAGTASLSLQGDDLLDDSLQQRAVELELFDLLGQRSRMLPYTRVGSSVAASQEPASGSDELKIITAEYHNHLCTLLSSL